MKKLNRFKILTVLNLILLAKAYPAGETLVFDPSNWLTALDTLYKSYDMINNQITAIEQNYERMQHYIEQARSFDFQNIQWDGDINFRDEIANATSQVNRQLNNIRGIRDSFYRENLRVNGKNFSLADLCNFTSNGSNLGDYVDAVKIEIERNNRKAKAALTYGVTDEEKQYIWAKYGLSPANYQMVNDVKFFVEKATAEIIGNDIETMVTAREIHERKLQTVENIINMLDHEGELTQKEISQAQTYLMSETIQSMEELKQQIVSAASYQIWKDKLDKQRAMGQKDSQAQYESNTIRKAIPQDF